MLYPLNDEGPEILFLHPFGFDQEYSLVFASVDSCKLLIGFLFIFFRLYYWFGFGGFLFYFFFLFVFVIFVFDFLFGGFGFLFFVGFFGDGFRSWHNEYNK